MSRASLDTSIRSAEKAYKEMGFVVKRPDEHIFKVVAKVKEGLPDVTQVTIIDETYAIFESACEYKPDAVKSADIDSALARINESISIGFFSYDSRGFLKFRTSCLVPKEGETPDECMEYIKLCLQSQKQILEELERTIGPVSGERGIANEAQLYLPKKGYVDHMIG